MYKKNKTPIEIAEIIEHLFSEVHPNNGCEFLPDRRLSEVAKLQREQAADEQLKIIAAQLREMEREHKVSS